MNSEWVVFTYETSGKWIPWNKKNYLHKIEFNSPQLFCLTNLAAISLFWSTNMATMTSCENGLYVHANFKVPITPKTGETKWRIIWSNWRCLFGGFEGFLAGTSVSHYHTDRLKWCACDRDHSGIAIQLSSDRGDDKETGLNRVQPNRSPFHSYIFFNFLLTRQIIINQTAYLTLHTSYFKYSTIWTGRFCSGLINTESTQIKLKYSYIRMAGLCTSV